MGLELLLQETKGLSEEALMEVVRFVRFMKTESSNMVSFANVKSGISNMDGEKNRIRTAGKYRNKGWMADDFDSPIDDFKEYMQ